MVGEKTEALREECDRRGIRYTCGLLLEGRPVDEDTFTTLWPDGEAAHSLTVEDDHGHLCLFEELSVEQCIAAAMAGVERSSPHG